MNSNAEETTRLEHMLYQREQKELTQWIRDHYQLHHVVLGHGIFNPIVVFDPTAIPSSFPPPVSLQVADGVATTLQYERVLAGLSMNVKETKSIPLCLVCCTGLLRYP